MKPPTPPTPEFEDVFQQILADERACVGQSSYYGESMRAPAVRAMTELQRAEASILSKGFGAEIVDEELMNTTTAYDAGAPITIEQLNQTILESQAEQQENPIVASIICPRPYMARVKSQLSQVPKPVDSVLPPQMLFDSIPVYSYDSDGEFCSALEFYAEKWALVIYPDGMPHKIQLTSVARVRVFATYRSRKPVLNTLRG